MAKVILDAFLLAFSFILAYFVRFKVQLFITPTLIPIFERYSGPLIFIVILWLALFKLFGLYDKKYSSLIDEVGAIFFSVTVSSLVLFGFLFIYRGFWFSRLVILNAWAISLLLLTASRILFWWARRTVRKKNIGLKRVLILGSGEMGQALAKKIKNDPSLGYKIAAVLDDNASASFVFAEVKRKKISELVIAASNIEHQRIMDIITECETLGIEIKLIPGLLELLASRVDIDEVGGIPLVNIREIGLLGFSAFLKRCFDILLSGTIIIIISPFLLAAALGVKFTSPGPVFFLQKRVGKDGRVFNCYKFRSMVANAEELLPQLESRSETTGHIFKIKDDPRVTPLGHFIRRWSIDELPQLFNVLTGDMSLVGPRPPLPREVEKYNSWEKKRLRVRPGITGLWQVSGRSLLPFDDMVRLDIYYIENWSLWQDIKILLKTIPVVLLGSGAY
ncbi:MAG: sugar transferase [Candidatus Margulisiibacteriota bacterium]